ncbi:hypothetical protein BFW01_g3002 [Lasiodiplodia theobromae]|nr:hypothetical protein BFW01_g3002 [Lasiodiplodia theobromae]
MSEASDRIFSLIQRAVSKIAGYGDRITVLSPTRTPAAEKQRRHFIRVFVRRLADFAASERAKYPADPLSPPPPLLETNSSDDDYDSANPCVLTPSIDATLGDLMSRTGAERRAQSWTAPASYADERAELVMALVATNELLPLLPLARWRAPGGAERSEPMGLWAYQGANPGWTCWSESAEWLKASRTVEGKSAVARRENT